MVYLVIVNKVLCHCHFWLAWQCDQIISMLYNIWQKIKFRCQCLWWGTLYLFVWWSITYAQRRVQQYVSTLGRSLYWCQVLHITNKDRYQNNKRRKHSYLWTRLSLISPTFCQTCSGSKLFEILMIFLKDFFENVHFEKFSRQRTVLKKLPSIQIQLNLCKTGTQK